MDPVLFAAVAQVLFAEDAETTGILKGTGVTAVILAIGYVIREMWKTRSETKIKEDESKVKNSATVSEERRQDGLTFRQEAEGLFKAQTEHIKELSKVWEEDRKQLKGLQEKYDGTARRCSAVETRLARALERIRILEEKLKDNKIPHTPFDDTEDTGLHRPIIPTGEDEL